MVSTYKIGQKINYKGFRVIVTSVNHDGTATIHYAPGVGRTGFAGTLPSLSNKGISLAKMINATTRTPYTAEKGLTLSEENKALLKLNDELNSETKTRLSGITIARQLINFATNEDTLEELQANNKLSEHGEKRLCLN